MAVLLRFFFICLDFYWRDSECWLVKNRHISCPNTIKRFNHNEGKIITLVSVSKHRIKDIFVVFVINNVLYISYCDIFSSIKIVIHAFCIKRTWVAYFIISPEGQNIGQCKAEGNIFVPQKTLFCYIKKNTKQTKNQEMIWTWI